MLWIEITPKTVVTPISASAWAMRSPTGSSVERAAANARRRSSLSRSSDMAGGAAGNLELGTGDEARGRRAQKRDGAGDLVRRAEPLQRDVPAAGNLGYHSSRVCAGSLRATKRRSHWPESIRPSMTELTRMRGANSRASDFTRLCAPARAAEVATM